MNRAWIPAGALAGVSVAGLLALGPLTDSMSTPVSFPTTVHTQTSVPKDFVPVSVTVNRGAVGQTNTRGGPAATTNASNSSEGFVAFHRKPAAKRTSTAPATVTIKSTPAKPKPPAKKVVRQTSIGGASEPNGTSGLTGTGSGSSSTGEQQSTPGSGGN